MSEDMSKFYDERISELESTVRKLRSQLETTEDRISLGGGQSGFDVPGTLKPFIVPAILLKGEYEVGVAEKPGQSCFEEVRTPLTGEFVYKEKIADEKDCPLPSATDKAKAVIAARKNLANFGKTWCDEGDNNCKSRDCEPKLSKIVVDKYQNSSRPIAAGKKTCFVTAFITGTVLCECKK